MANQPRGLIEYQSQASQFLFCLLGAGYLWVLAGSTVAPLGPRNGRTGILPLPPHLHGVKEAQPWGCPLSSPAQSWRVNRGCSKKLSKEDGDTAQLD